MFSNFSIKAKLLMISLIAIVLVSILVAAESIYSVKELSKKEIANYRDKAYAGKEEELKNYVSLAMKMVESYHERTAIEKIKVEVQEDLKSQSKFIFSILESEYKKYKDILSEDELKDRLIGIVEGTRYGKSGYFWINDTNAIIVMHPFKPQLNGKDLDNYKDKGGKRIFHEFAEVAKSKGDGFVDYVWPKPGFETPQLKVSYVKLFEPYNWVLGTGEYVADVSSALKKEALKSIASMRYGKDGYFWINNSKPEMLMHATNESLVGKDLSNNVDAKGKKYFVEMVKVSNSKKEGGLVNYWWDKSNEKGDPKQKFSYVQKFEPWDFIIGTGAYVDDIESSIALMKENTESEISDIVTMISIFTLISILVIYLIYSFLIKKVIIDPLEDLEKAVSLLGSDDSKRSEIKKNNNDEIGSLVDSFNAYIKKLQDGYEEDSIVIAEVEDVIQKVNNGFYVYKVESNSSNPQIQKLRASINSMIDSTNIKLEEINNVLLEYGNSNFNYKSAIEANSSNGIVGSIFTSAKQLGGTVSEFLSMITSSGDKLNEDTDVLSSSSAQLSSSANEQAASLEETAAAVEEITSIIKSSNEKVNRMSTLANELNKSAKDGESLASRTTKAMDDIDTQVNSISDAITVIDQIAFQTNILSLNAAVEAATAGEAGKGFAVVAQEVRNLASRSAEAAKEIKLIVENATNKANEGKSIADNMIGGYTELNKKVNETIELISDVTEASKEQETGIIQINDVVNSLDQATQMNAASASQISSLANEVSLLSKNLLIIADKAKFDENKKAEICDIDLVFEMSKLKNDHVIFKNDNFSKVGTYSSWTVKACNECDFGKWIAKKESEGVSFTKTSNWNKMKESHESVHNLVQEYINKNAKKVPNSELVDISKKLEDKTSSLFKSMDIIKIEFCKDFKVKNEKDDVVPGISPEPIKIEKRDFTRNTEPKKNEIIKPKVSPKTITANNTDDDEWESF